MLKCWQLNMEGHTPCARSHNVRPSTKAGESGRNPHEIERKLTLTTAQCLLGYKSTMPAKLSPSGTLKSAGYFFIWGSRVFQ